MGDTPSLVTDKDGNPLGEAPAFTFYQISWESGIIEAGSSGSGLFDEQGRLVGVLSHGDCTCDGRGTAGYGRLSMAFPELRRYLVDDNL